MHLSALLVPLLFGSLAGLAGCGAASSAAASPPLAGRGQRDSCAHDVDPLAPSPRALDLPDARTRTRLQLREKLLQSLFVTDEARAALAGLEQGTPEWLQARQNRLTGSNFGAAAGHNKFKTPLQLAHDMLYSTFQGNDATRWGNAHEAVACNEYVLSRRAQLREKAKALGAQAQPADAHDADFYVTHSGLNVDPSLHWLAVSPDGHVHEHGLEAGE